MASISNLSLSDEDDELEIPNDDISNQSIDNSCSLVGRFLTNKPIRGYMMTEIIAEFWHPGRGVDIKETEPNFFTFKFFHYRDMQCILKKGTWYFDNHLLILDVLPENTPPKHVPFQSVPFWVQIHDIPTSFMTERVGKELGNFIGDFLEYDVKNKSNHLRSHMRIRVLIDVTKPLKRQKKIKRPGGETRIVKFKYERFGNFCYYCGTLGHIEDYCEKLYSITDDDGVRHWGPELHVERQRNAGRRSKWLREEGQEWSPPSVVAGNGSAADISNGPTLNTESSTSKTVNLINLLKNPHLLRPSKSNEFSGTTKSPHDEALNEENAEAVITTTAKRSRAEFNANDMSVDSSVKCHQIVNQSPPQPMIDVWQVHQILSK